MKKQTIESLSNDIDPEDTSNFHNKEVSNDIDLLATEILKSNIHIDLFDLLSMSDMPMPQLKGIIPKIINSMIDFAKSPEVREYHLRSFKDFFNKTTKGCWDIRDKQDGSPRTLESLLNQCINENIKP